MMERKGKAREHREKERERENTALQFYRHHKESPSGLSQHRPALSQLLSRALLSERSK